MYNEYFSNRERSAMNNPAYNAGGPQFHNVSGPGYYMADEGFYNVGGQSTPGCDPNIVEDSQPFILSIANSTTTAVAGVILLDANTATLPTTTNFGNAAAITITLQNGNLTYGQFLNQIKAKPFRVAQLMLNSTTASQVLNSITFTTFDTFGAQTVFSKTPYLNPFQNQSGSTIVDYPFTVDGNTKLAINISASATLILYLFPNKVYDFGRGLVGRNVNIPLGNPNVSGLRLLGGAGMGQPTKFTQIGH